MQHDEAKMVIRQILEQDIVFEGNFDKCFNNLKETQQADLINWIQSCKERKENVILSKQDKDLVGFVKKFGSNLRVILTKVKGKYFIALFLDKHKYYEIEMQKLGF